MIERPRLAEALGALSLATDLVVGMPPETGLGSAILAVRLGERVGLDEEALAATYYATITRFLGCTATSAEAASFALGEDQALYRALAMCDWTDADEVAAAVDRHVAPDAPAAERREALRTIREAHEAIPSIAAAHCTQAMLLAERLPVPASVPALLSHIYDRWDGLVPGSAGDAIPLPARIISLAAAAEAFRRAGGVAATIEMVRSRAGRHFDPELCRLLERDASALFEGFAAVSHWEPWLHAEPGDPIGIEPGTVDDVAAAFADFIDQKSPCLLGHSRQVSSLAARGGEACALDAEAVNALRRAALVHDIGRAAVANGIWDKPGALTRMERVHMQSHPYHTNLMLSSTGVFGEIADLASMAHERRDGSGYHRRLHLSDPCGSLLAAADVYDALTHDRPWRDAFDAATAADLLLAEGKAGRLAAEAVGAVLDAAGHPPSTTRLARPAGLTPRELEIVTYLARGTSTKKIAYALGISPKTAGHHIESVYDKTGARGRAAVALFALKHGLFSP